MMTERAKTIIVVLIAIIFVVICCIGIYLKCVRESTNAKTEEPDDMLIEIETHFSYAIAYDKDTKVMYFRGCSAEADLCPLYNADGSLKLYSGGNNND